MTESDHVSTRTVGRAIVHVRQPRKHRWLATALNVMAVLTLLGAITAPLWLPRLIRLLVPPRYIATYVPIELQHLIYYDINADTMPTPGTASGGDSSALLAELDLTAQAAAPSPTPVIGESSSGGPVPIPSPTSSQDGLPPPPTAIPASAMLYGFTYDPQGWNNCGPTTLTMALSYWNMDITQEEAGQTLKGSIEDVNVSPDEIAAYVETLGLGTTVSVNGTIALIKRLIAAGYPVVIERGFDELPEEGWMGHYMLIVGDSDETQQLAALDSYWSWRNHSANGYPIENWEWPDYWDYARLDSLWRHFNRTYYVIYPPSDAAVVASIIGADMDDRSMYAAGAERARTELVQNQQDLWGWFNLGSNLTGLGDYQNAAAAFDQAQSIGLPRRTLWYLFTPYEAYLQVGRYDDVISLAVWPLNSSRNPQSESVEAWYYRGLAVLAQGNRDDARYFFNQALIDDPHFERAR